MPAHRLPQRLVLAGIHRLHEVEQRQTTIVSLREHGAHHPCRVRAAAQDGLVVVGPAGALPGQPALAVQPVHDGHDRGVGQHAGRTEQFPDVADRHRTSRGPHPIHDRGFQVSQLLHTFPFDTLARMPSQLSLTRARSYPGRADQAAAGDECVPRWPVCTEMACRLAGRAGANVPCAPTAEGARFEGQGQGRGAGLTALLSPRRSGR
ncbi:hypothetical protein FMEAI12_4320006 [Parafrankia sp. Ea1.12]|nr:hypothetical protein FMEAI12_4320006 [Parafrankia sp. Ea1.12]